MTQHQGRSGPAELFIPDVVASDERLWVQTAENTWLRPVLLSLSQGYWISIARIRRQGIVSRHRHPQPVHGYVLKGSWRYLEHDWVAKAGSYIYEPPGDTHTLVVDKDCDEMITMFQVHGSLVYVSEDGTVEGYDDVFTRLSQCQRHFEAVGLGADFVNQFIR